MARSSPTLPATPRQQRPGEWPLRWFLAVVFVRCGAGVRDQREPLASRLKVGDEVQCEATWKVVGILGQGAQGRVLAVTGNGTGPVRALKVDLSSGGAYHRLIREFPKGKDHLEKGMRHEAVTECGILEALQEKKISHVPRCFAACQLEGHNAFVMTAAVDQNLKRGPMVFLQTWQKLQGEQRRLLAHESVHFLFDVVQAEVMASDVEAFLDGSGSLMVVDWGGGMTASYKSGAKFFSGPNDLLFTAGLPSFPGMASVIHGACTPDHWSRPGAAQQRQLLPEIIQYLGEAFCQLSRSYEDWARITVRGAIRQALEKCGRNAIPTDFLACQ